MQSYLLMGKLTLAYLYAQFPISIDPERVMVLPSHHISSVDEAAKKLDDLPKPVFCEATIMENILAVKCVPTESGGYSTARNFFEEAGGHGLDFHGDTASVESPFFDRGVPYEDLIEWLHDYQFAAINGVGVSVDKNDTGNYHAEIYFHPRGGAARDGSTPAVDSSHH